MKQESKSTFGESVSMAGLAERIMVQINSNREKHAPRWYRPHVHHHHTMFSVRTQATFLLGHDNEQRQKKKRDRLAARSLYLLGTVGVRSQRGPL